MIISKEQQEKLKKLWKNKAEITIKGFNTYGEPFETTGRIATDDRLNSGVYGNYVMVEFGVSKKNPSKKQTKWFAPYCFHWEEENMEHAFIAPPFIVEEVKDKNGKVIVKNLDAKKYLNVAKHLGEDVKNEARNLGRLINKNSDYYKDNLVLKKLCEECVGKPITLCERDVFMPTEYINEKNAVFIGCHRFDNRGEPIIEFAYGPHAGSCSISYNCVAISEKNNGEKEILADNMLSGKIWRNELSIIQNLETTRCGKEDL